MYIIHAYYLEVDGWMDVGGLKQSGFESGAELLIFK